MLLLGAAVAACGAASAQTVRIGGTGAAQGLLLRLSEAFNLVSPGDRLEVVPGLGSSGAIAAIVEGALSVAVVARPLNDAETAKGVRSTPWLETPFIFVSSSPRQMALSRAEVVAAFGGELRTWSDGSSIKPILRPRSDAMTDMMIAHFDGMQAALEKTRRRPDVPLAATDQDNAQLAAKVPNSLAAMTLLQLTTEQPQLRVVALDGVKPSLVRMEEGSYLLRVALQLVVGERSSQVTQRFLSFVRTPIVERIIRESGGLPLAVHSVNGH